MGRDQVFSLSSRLSIFILLGASIASLTAIWSRHFTATRIGPMANSSPTVISGLISSLG